MLFKRFVSSLIACLLLVALSACGEDPDFYTPDDTKRKDTTPSAPDKDLYVMKDDPPGYKKPEHKIGGPNRPDANTIAKVFQAQFREVGETTTEEATCAGELIFKDTGFSDSFVVALVENSQPAKKDEASATYLASKAFLTSLAQGCFGFKDADEMLQAERFN